MQGVEGLTRLRVLDVASNALTEVGGGLAALAHLSDLWLNDNRIQASLLLLPEPGSPGKGSLQPCEQSPGECRSHWRPGTGCAATATACMQGLAALAAALAGPAAALSCVYLAGNPVAADAAAYRGALLRLLPNLEQLDADVVDRAEAARARATAASAATTPEPALPGPLA